MEVSLKGTIRGDQATTGGDGSISGIPAQSEISAGCFGNEGRLLAVYRCWVAVAVGISSQTREDEDDKALLRPAPMASGLAQLGPA